MKQDAPAVDKLTIAAAIYQAATPENLEELQAFGNAGPIADAVLAAIHASGVGNKPLNAEVLHLAATPTPLTPDALPQGEVQGWTVWDAEARMAREGDWRGVAYSIAHDILPLIPKGSPDHAYQERARMQIKAADRLCAALTRLNEGGDR